MNPAVCARPARARREAPSPWLHNMSAPPRATITLRPLRRPGADGRAAAVTGFRPVCRIDVVGRFWPVPPGTPRDPAEGIDWGQTLEPHRRLLAHAIAEERGEQAPDAQLAARIDAMLADSVLEALREVAARADCAALGLPAFGLLRPAGGAPHAHSASTRVAVAVLARRRGGLFLRDADPLAPASVTEALDLWAPHPLHDTR
jgi:hypothetical protein